MLCVLIQDGGFLTDFGGRLALAMAHEQVDLHLRPNGLGIMTHVSNLRRKQRRSVLYLVSTT
jgi:hypothetical protein